MSDAPFRRRVVRWLVLVIGVSFLSALFWGLMGDEVRDVTSARPDSFSRSALGHHALVGLLRELGLSVSVSRFDSAAKAGDGALLVVAEPDPYEAGFEGMLRRAERVLLVLPKWEGTTSETEAGYVRFVELVPRARIAAVLDALEPGASVTRPASLSGRWSTGGLDGAATLISPQLVLSPEIEPLVWCDEGILFGQLGPNRFVLSDPDLLNNHGLVRDENAVFAVGMLERARGGRESIVLDETLHGYLREPSLVRSLFEFPLVLATLQSLLAVGVLLWAGMARFGAPRPVAATLGAGKEFLIENIASLLRFGGQSSHVLRRYLKTAQAAVHRRLHVPAGASAEEAREWLDRHAEVRGIEGRLGRLEREVARAVGSRHVERVLVAARRIHRWKEEMIHGPRERS